MLLELSEVLACPQCGPPQVMVAVVQESVGHRVTSIYCEMHHSLFDLSGVDIDEKWFLAGVDRQGDTLAYRPVEHLLNSVDGFIEVHIAERDGSPVGKRQQFAGEDRQLVACVDYFIQVTVDF